jgi:cyclopropane fatty-acyl-phospholipid synthase-like methyltransferase
MKQPKIQRVLDRLPDIAQILRGSLLHRTIRHKQGCPKCAAGGGHPVWILATGYPGKRIHQLTLRVDQVPQVRRSLANFHKLQADLEQVCELNREQLREARDHDDD